MAKAPKRIVVIDGHPDTRPERFMRALVGAYRAGALGAGHDVRLIEVGALEFPLLRTSEDFRKGSPPDTIRAAQQAIAWADHLVIAFPLWLGAMPALLKGFLEQALRPGFAFGEARKGSLPKKLLAGKTARIIVTMGMPGLFYRWYYGAHSLKSLEKNILAFCGIRSTGAHVIGMIEGMSAKRRTAWLGRMTELGRKAC
jgi:putative NADPH-quinone reductase